MEHAFKGYVFNEDCTLLVHVDVRKCNKCGLHIFSLEGVCNWKTMFDANLNEYYRPKLKYIKHNVEIPIECKDIFGYIHMFVSNVAGYKMDKIYSIDSEKCKNLITMFPYHKLQKGTWRTIGLEEIEEINSNMG